MTTDCAKPAPLDARRAAAFLGLSAAPWRSGTPAAAPFLMPAMRRKRAAIPAPLHRAGHIERAMPSQDCLFIRLSDYFEARRHRPDRDGVSEALADGQAPQSAEARRPEREGSVGDQGR